jgi:hypothetical protein
MATYDYMENQPTCTLWRDTGGHCCPDGTHQKDCLYTQYRNEKHSNWRLILAACVVASISAWAAFAFAIWLLVG